MKYLPWLALVVALLAGWSYHERKIGEMNGRIAHLVSESRRVDTIYRLDTLRLTKIRRVTDSLVKVRLETDTVIQVDTVRLWLSQERQACDQALLTCERRVAIRDSIIGVLKKKPSVWSHLPWVAAGLLGGVVLTR